ncbi:hypothetical protein QUA13_13575 [Microcoleus sp. S28C3]|uniref:hypothetical protein n=1 Tax=Microcoleus sp. S28C3 TaxID=3055414 RepID=UPI002FD28546
MSNVNVGLSCRHCRYYEQHGHRGGNCQMLGVAVHGGWKACPLLVPPFAPSWEYPAEAGRSPKSQMLQGATILQAIPPP